MLWEGRLHKRVHGGVSEANLGTAVQEKADLGKTLEQKVAGTLEDHGVSLQ